MFGYPMFLGGAILLGGLTRLRGPTYFEIDDQKIIVYAMIPPLKLTYRFASWDDIVYQQGKLFVMAKGAQKRVRIYRSQARPKDWLAFETFLIQKQTIS